MPRLILFAFLALLPFTGKSQPEDSLQNGSKKFHKSVAVASGAAYVGGLFWLDRAWYKTGKQNFHFFNDNRNWLQADKAGHAFSAFHLSRYGYALARNSGLSEKKSALLSVFSGGILLLPVEVFDGFSPDYGASYGDVMANFTGSALYGLQRLVWGEERIFFKISYRESAFPAMRPATFGSNLPEKILKDYNGQTLWLTFDTEKLFRTKSKFLRFCHLSAGYAGRNMFYSETEKSAQAGYVPHRAFYLSADFALQNIKTRKKWLKTLFDFISVVKIPAPALEFSEGRFKFHPIYF